MSSLKSQWSVEASTTGRWDDNVQVLFSAVPRQSLAERGLPEGKFWQDLEAKVRSRARMAGLGEEAVRTYIRRAKSNQGLLIALVVRYE